MYVCADEGCVRELPSPPKSGKKTSESLSCRAEGTFSTGVAPGYGARGVSELVLSAIVTLFNEGSLTSLEAELP